MNPPQSVADWAILIIMILAIAAVVWVAVTYLGIPIPQWVITIVTIVVLAVLAIWAIRTVSRA